jgi:starch phosphorylase
MKSIIPRFNSQRMLMDYINKYYVSAIKISRKLQENQGSKAQELADWKKAVYGKWQGLTIRRLDDNVGLIQQGSNLTIRVSVNLNGLDEKSVHVECLMGSAPDAGEFEVNSVHQLVPAGQQGSETIYEINFTPDVSGLVAYKLRVYPYQKLLCHPFEMGCMKWV